MESATEEILSMLRDLPASQVCKIIDFEKAEVRPGFVGGTFFLVVSGNAPCFNTDVKLVPLVYIRRPEYWEIEVVGCMGGPICLPEIQPFTESLPLDGVLGTKGIEVVGATRRVRIDVPPCAG
jgi:hypothetical protein